jgi:3-(methylsulfanyl)propanoyl-CoA dehydrogenase
MARQALAATARLASAQAERALLEAKVVTARFYCTQLLPQAAALVPAVTAGAPDLVRISADRF